MLHAGDRVRLVELGDAGLPWVRYGWVSRMAADTDVAVVLFDDALDDERVEAGRLEPVSLPDLRLELEGSDLLAEPVLRAGLAGLWAAEAERAGLDVAGLRRLDGGSEDSRGAGSYAIAELVSAGRPWILAAYEQPDQPGRVVVAPRRAGPWL